MGDESSGTWDVMSPQWEPVLVSLTRDCSRMGSRWSSEDRKLMVSTHWAAEDIRPCSLFHSFLLQNEPARNVVT